MSALRDASEGVRHPRIDLGAYLLAILPLSEEAVITAHLAECDDCVLTLMNLADTLPALRRLDPAVMLAYEESASLAGAYPAGAGAGSGADPTADLAAPLRPPSAGHMMRPGSRRPARSGARGASGRARRSAASRGPGSSRRIKWGAGVAAAAAAIAVVAVPAAIGDAPSGSVAGPTSSPTASVSGAVPLGPALAAQSRTFEYTGSDTVTVTYAAVANGSSVNVRCQSGSDWKPQPGDASRTYELWIIRQDGTAVWVRSWPPVHGDATFPGWVGFTPQQFKTFQLRDGEGNVLSEADA